MSSDSPDSLTRLLAHLDLESTGEGAFRGHSWHAPNGRIFGGLVFAQAMSAALRTVEGRLPHSAHAYFLRPGDPKQPIDFEVDGIRDGRSFTTRRVVARQEGAAILNLALSCHREELGPRHQIDHPIPAEPEGEPYEEGLVRNLRGRGIELTVEALGFQQPIEIRIEGGLEMLASELRAPTLNAWLKSRGPLPDDPALHSMVLAYASDLTVMVPALHPAEFGLMSPGVQSASLDHSIWFHDTFRIDDWLYAVQDGPIVSRSRGLGRMLVYTRDGRLVASCVQEGLVRKAD